MKIQHEDQEVEVTHSRNGNNIWHRITFIATSNNEIKDVGELQRKAGFHPCGYDGPWGAYSDQRSNGYVTTWKCSASCD